MPATNNWRYIHNKPSLWIRRASTVAPHVVLETNHKNDKVQENSNQQKDVHDNDATMRILIHWKGEGTEGYSMQFRHLEFENALSAVLQQKGRSQTRQLPLSLTFFNALNYTQQDSHGNANNNILMPEHKIIRYNQAMQYLHLKHHPTIITSSSSDDDDDNPARQSKVDLHVTTDDIIQAVQRCSLIHAAYQIVAQAKDSYSDLNAPALRSGLLDDMRDERQNKTWCVRVRHYYNRPVNNINNNNTTIGQRHGERTRSLSLERQALKALKPLLLTFAGGVNLQHPDTKLYVFDGLLPYPQQQGSEDEEEKDHQQGHNDYNNGSGGGGATQKNLARELALGPRISTIAPATRLCVTNTPLCPTAAYLLCNAAQIQPHQSLLDPYGGSCTILLAASMMVSLSSSVSSSPLPFVSIDIAHNGLVNRDDIRRDFATRNLPPPLAVIHGNSTDPAVRQQARNALRQQQQQHAAPQNNYNGHGNPASDDSSPSSSSLAFDCIISDPPYGVRESINNYNENEPIQDLLNSIVVDRDAGHPLLKVGGRLVVFLPCSADQDLQRDVLPGPELLDEAGLVLVSTTEQPLNARLSRWLAVFDCVR